MVVMEALASDIPYQLLVSIPAALAVIYVVRLFLASQRDWKKDLEAVVKVSNDVIEKNSQAMLANAAAGQAMAAAVGNCRMLQDQLRSQLDRLKTQKGGTAEPC